MKYITVLLLAGFISACATEHRARAALCAGICYYGEVESVSTAEEAIIAEEDTE